MQNHGSFTIGTTAKAAVKAAVMCEEVARTVHIARQLGQPLPIAQSDIDSLFDRYQNVYGQTEEQMIMTPYPTCWFLTGSQGLYGPETLAQVEQQSRADRRSTQRRRHPPGARGVAAGAHRRPARSTRSSWPPTPTPTASA